MGLHQLIGEQKARLATVSHARLRERVLILLDLYLLLQKQVELIEHLAEGVRAIED